MTREISWSSSWIGRRKYKVYSLASLEGSKCAVWGKTINIVT